MTRNESNLDRALRVIVGAVLLVAWIAGWLTGAWAVVLGIVGLILVLTGVVGFCPAYRLFGISTSPGAPRD
jgi:O-antigen/teichoic acid export membrane protein